MKTKIITMGILLAIGLCANAQGNKPVEPKGKAIVKIFGNFNTGFGDDSDTRGFLLDRSYLGYEYDFGNGLSVKSVMDMGKSSDVSDMQRNAFVKNAMITWKVGRLKLCGGLISTTQFNLQEKAWGGRYIMKSFQDKYKFGSSADMGLSATYKIADWLSADAIVVNGEGYKKIQVGNGLNYGLGLTLAPIEGLQVRLYGGFNEGNVAGDEDIVNLAAYAGYKCSLFSFGAEYNYMKNAKNVLDNDLYGYSLYTSVNLSDNISLFARLDDLSSSNDWNIAKDELSTIFGAQFKVGKHVKLAPNFRVNMPKASSADNTYWAHVDCSINL